MNDRTLWNQYLDGISELRKVPNSLETSLASARKRASQRDKQISEASMKKSQELQILGEKLMKRSQASKNELLVESGVQTQETRGDDIMDLEISSAAKKLDQQISVCVQLARHIKTEKESQNVSAQDARIALEERRKILPSSPLETAPTKKQGGRPSAQILVLVGLAVFLITVVTFTIVV